MKSFKTYIAVAVAVLAFRSDALAATLGLGPRPSQEDMRAIQTGFKRTFKKYETGQLGGYTHVAKIITVKEGEKTENTIKQMIYKVFTDYATPEEIAVEEVSADISGIRSAVATALSELLNNPELGTEEADRVRLRSTTLVAERLESVDARLFQGGHGNSFGSSSFMVLFDRENQELLLIGSQYAE